MKLYSDKNSKYNAKCRYVAGGEVEGFPKSLGWWERDLSFMKRELDDISFKVELKHVGRVDMISYEVYKRVDLDWLILQYNNIVDINEEIVVGKILVMPSIFRAQMSILVS